jgi:hypothetical protein
MDSIMLLVHLTSVQGTTYKIGVPWEKARTRKSKKYEVQTQTHGRTKQDPQA